MEIHQNWMHPLFDLEAYLEDHTLRASLVSGNYMLVDQVQSVKIIAHGILEDFPHFAEGCRSKVQTLLVYLNSRHSDTLVMCKSAKLYF